MAEVSPTVAGNALVLDAETAADLMTTDPVSIRQDAPLSEAIDLLTTKDVSAIPVLDAAERPVGVLSRTDLIRYYREKGGSGSDSPQGGPSAPAAQPVVRDIMTPALLSVALPTTAVEVVAHLLGLGNVQQLFVLDGDGFVVGVVSARDVLRRLRRLAAS
jgi:CBS domain-containing protein